MRASQTFATLIGGRLAACYQMTQLRSIAMKSGGIGRKDGEGHGDCYLNLDESRTEGVVWSAGINGAGIEVCRQEKYPP